MNNQMIVVFGSGSRIQDRLQRAGELVSLMGTVEPGVASPFRKKGKVVCHYRSYVSPGVGKDTGTIGSALNLLSFPALPSSPSKGLLEGWDFSKPKKDQYSSMEVIFIPVDIALEEGVQSCIDKARESFVPSEDYWDLE